MNNGDISGGIGQLRDALDVLQASWTDAREEWRDGNSRSFEEEFVIPVGIELSRSFTVIQRLSDVLKQAERDCEPW